MATRRTAMSEVIEQGHHVASKAPSLAKGQFQQIGTFVDEGEMTTIMPKAISVNMKTNKLQNGEN